MELTDDEQKRYDSYVNRARSYSQTRQWYECGHAFLLARIKRVPEVRGAWLEQGVAVHAVIEDFEKGGRKLSEDQLRTKYQERYSGMINASLDKQPNPDMWFNSGPYKGLPNDIERRYQVGQEQVASYLRWTQDHPEQRIWKDAVEIRFDLELEGVTVLGYIDQVVTHEKKKGQGVRDVKTGLKPTEHTQLELYTLALNELYDAGVEWGDYWLGKTGRTSRPIPMSPDRSKFIEWFGKMDAGVKAGDFRPNPGESCARCPVQMSCEYRVDA
ncbi:PD-(D/E)XK nuclease family protein [Streptomyces sp. NBC_00197]|uniref:PD-(D/E)XK nuclease family protein n=1 Tax=Streptomyces sp. NBC_00197 TaxID=2975676 RepID=UPI00324505FB